MFATSAIFACIGWICELGVGKLILNAKGQILRAKAGLFTKVKTYRYEMSKFLVTSASKVGDVKGKSQSSE